MSAKLCNYDLLNGLPVKELTDRGLISTSILAAYNSYSKYLALKNYYKPTHAVLQIALIEGVTERTIWNRIRLMQKEI